MKFPALGGHSIEVDCNVIEKSLHFMHFCTIDFEEMTDPFNPHISHSDLDHKIFRSILGSAFHCFETAKREAS